MSKRISNYLNEMPIIKSKIENYPLIITEGTKKVIKEYAKFAANERNNCVRKLSEAYNEDLKIIRKCLTYKLNNLKPKYENPYISSLKDETKVLKKLFKYTNKYNDVYDKTKLAKIVYDLDSMESNNLANINQILLYVIGKFKKANVILNAKDFNYSTYTKAYMEVLFTNIESADLNTVMEDEFNKIYWKCPTILTHIKLNIRLLAKKYEKELAKYCTNRQNELFKETSTTLDTFEENYVNNEKQVNYLIATDDYLNVNKFLKKELNIPDYLEDSSTRLGKLNRFLKDKKFEDLTDIEKEKYFSDILSLQHTLDEVINCNMFSKVISDIKSRYNEISKNKGLLKTKQKEIDKLDAKREKLVKSCFPKKSLFGYKKINEGKLNSLIAETEEVINNLNKEYRELDDIRINDKIGQMINKGSTIYDGISLANSFYGYLKSTIVKNYEVTDIKEVDDLINKFKEFVFDSDNIVTRDLNLFNENDFTSLIRNKCLLLNINIDEDSLVDLNMLKSDIDIVANVYYLSKLGITLNDIKFIYDVSNLI